VELSPKVNSDNNIKTNMEVLPSEHNYTKPVGQ